MVSISSSSAAGSGSSVSSKGGHVFYVEKVGSNYSALDYEGNVIYGGSGNTGGITGTDGDAVIQEAIDNV